MPKNSGWIPEGRPIVKFQQVRFVTKDHRGKDIYTELCDAVMWKPRELHIFLTNLLHEKKENVV